MLNTESKSDVRERLIGRQKKKGIGSEISTKESDWRLVVKLRKSNVNAVKKEKHGNAKENMRGGQKTGRTSRGVGQIN